MIINRRQYLLIQLASECNEVSHILTKGLHFGLEDHYPELNIENSEMIMKEIGDLLATLGMCLDEKILTRWSDERMRFHCEAKRLKIEKYMGYSKSRHILT